MSVSVNPFGDYVVAQSEKAPAKTGSGLYLPDKATEKSKVAKVLAVGPVTKQVKVGDRILYKNYSSTEVKLDGIEYLLVKEEDILACLKEAADE